MMQIKSIVAATFVAVVVAGCASGVKREGGDAAAIAGQAVQRLPVGAVSVKLSAEAQKLAADNPKFDQEKLLYTVRRGLEANGLLASGTPARAEIVVTDFRVRGTFSAVMWGVMAGTDNVTGDVIVLDSTGRPMRKFTVNASYGLGGFAGGQDDMRLGWLYEKFTEHTVAELGGPKKD